MDGIINVYKEKGYTSHDVVAKLRGILKQKKIGHTGTLDPMAEGVLPVCVGKATKVCELLSDRDKTYEATLLLGVATDTQDTTGSVLFRTEKLPGAEAIREAILGFIGEYGQIPPMYSALKVNGRKLYELARAGLEVERAARLVTIREIRILELTPPRARMEVSCSKGTYIRTLCHDIGEKLGVGGCMESLLRTKAGPFTLDRSLKLGEIENCRDRGRLEDILIPVDSLFTEYPARFVKDAYHKFLYNGNKLEEGFFREQMMEIQEGQHIRVYDGDGKFAGIYACLEGGDQFKPLKLFL